VHEPGEQGVEASAENARKLRRHNDF
jgi:hypothetical protein